jgi:hypothetical protein
LKALQLRALDEAGLEPSNLKGGTRPEGLSKEDRQAISRADYEVGSRTTEVARAGVQQEALDVCKAQLWL